MMTKKQADRLIDSGEAVLFVMAEGDHLLGTVVLYYRGVITITAGIKIACDGIAEWHGLRHTFTEAKERLQRVKMTIKKTEWNEYRVNLLGGSEATASYTDDIEDAVATGFAMAKWRDEK